MKNLALFLLPVVLLSGCPACVDPGHRGVKTTMGRVHSELYDEGLTWTSPFSTIHEVSIQQQRGEMKNTECYSSDLQQINANLTVLYRIPPERAIEIFQKYNGNPFETLVVPRVNEALKEATAIRTAANIVQDREQVKQLTLTSARTKVGDMVTIVDIVIEDLSLSKELEAAIESKMVQQQEANKAEFTKQKAKVDAETAIIRARGEAEAINIKGAAIRDNPKLIDLQTVEKWDGKSPLVVGGGNSNILLPIGKESR